MTYPSRFISSGIQFISGYTFKAFIFSNGRRYEIKPSLTGFRYFSRSYCIRQSEFRNYSVKEVKIDVPGGVIAGKLWERDNPQKSSPPIICVHGWLDNAGSFDTLIPHLMSKSTSASTFFAFDLPGHGFTTYCPTWWYDAHVEGVISIQRVLWHFGWEKASYVGHSMGGIIGFIFTSFFPDSIEKFVALENIRPLQQYSLIPLLKSSFDLVFEVEERANGPRKGYPFEELVQKFCVARQNTVSLEGCRILLKRGAIPLGKKEEDKWKYSHSFRTLIPGQEGRFNVKLCEELASNIKSPVCFIKADPGNVYETDEEMEQFFGCLKQNLGAENVERHKCKGNHQFHLDNPEDVADVIVKFLDS